MKIELSKASIMQTYHANKHRLGGPNLKEGNTVYLRRNNIKTKRPSSKIDITKLGPFVIRNKFGPVIYRLRLPKIIRVYLVFHIGLIEPTEYPLKEQEPVKLYKEI